MARKKNSWRDIADKGARSCCIFATCPRGGCRVCGNPGFGSPLCNKTWDAPEFAPSGKAYLRFEGQPTRCAQAGTPCLRPHRFTTECRDYRGVPRE